MEEMQYRETEEMTLQQYKDYVNAKVENGEVIEEKPSAEVLKAWFDERIAIIKEFNRRLSEEDFKPVWGKPVSPNYYEHEVRMCDISIEPRIHIFSGIEAVAQALGCPLYVSVRDDDIYPIELYTNYNGVRMFELRSKDTTVK